MLENPEVELPDDQTVRYGEEIVLEVSGNYRLGLIEWENALGESICTNCTNLHLRVTESTTYTVHLTNEYGCRSSDTVTLTVRTDCVDADFLVPNIISPNGDGVNDFFYVLPQFDVDLKWLRIYDRWGELIFSADDFNQKWDGTFKGQPLNPGVYVYYLEVSCPNQSPYKKLGNVTIIK